jgi:hypothetical protein
MATHIRDLAEVYDLANLQIVFHPIVIHATSQPFRRERRAISIRFFLHAAQF